MITRKMQVEERNERLNEMTFELRQKNPLNRNDDRMTLVVTGNVPPLVVGSYVMVTIEEA